MGKVEVSLRVLKHNPQPRDWTTQWTGAEGQGCRKMEVIQILMSHVLASVARAERGADTRV